MVLSQLGVMVTKSKLIKSPLLKYRAIARVDENGRNYHVGIVLRLNGRWEVYSDFMLVYDWYDKTHQCVDIETDFNQFYLKFVENSHKILEPVRLDAFDDLPDDDENKTWKVCVRRVRHHWRNRICYDTTKALKGA